MYDYNTLNEDENAEEDVLQDLPKIPYGPQQVFNDGTKRHFRVSPRD